MSGWHSPTLFFHATELSSQSIRRKFLERPSAEGLNGQWDFRDDPRSISGGPGPSPVDLFDANFMGSPGAQDPGPGQPLPPESAIGEPWLKAGFYDPLAGTPGHPRNRDGPGGSGNPADPPLLVGRPFNYPPGPPPSPMPTAKSRETEILGFPVFGPAVPNNPSSDPNFGNYFRTALEQLHNEAHIYFGNVSAHIAFRDPFVYLLHSNVDRIFAQWQCDPMHPERLDPNTVYGSESNMTVTLMH